MRHLNLRLPDDLHADLVALAKAQQRSLNSEIIWLLRQGLGDRNHTPRRVGPDSPSA